MSHLGPVGFEHFVDEALQHVSFEHFVDEALQHVSFEHLFDEALQQVSFVHFFRILTVFYEFLLFIHRKKKSFDL